MPRGFVLLRCRLYPADGRPYERPHGAADLVTDHLGPDLVADLNSDQLGPDVGADQTPILRHTNLFFLTSGLGRPQQ